MDKSEDQTGFPHASGSKNDDSVIIALFWHISKNVNDFLYERDLRKNQKNDD